MPVNQPKHALRTWTTGQLSDYQRELDDALKHLPEFAEVRGLLRYWLAEVRTELAGRSGG